MRISDWSSDVCSSDLLATTRQRAIGDGAHQPDCRTAVDQPDTGIGQGLAERMRRVAICGPRTIAGTAKHAKPHHSFTVNSSCERRHIHATTPQVTAAPAITDGPVPSSFAARPRSEERPGGKRVFRTL